MLKPFNEYTLDIAASVNGGGVAGQILCYQAGRFVGRIDFWVGEDSLPVSYLWHPNGTSDPNQIYIVLMMPMTSFGMVEEILRTEKSFGLEIYPIGPMIGAVTDGFGGNIRSLNLESVGEQQRKEYLAPRSKK